MFATKLALSNRAAGAVFSPVATVSAMWQWLVVTGEQPENRWNNSYCCMQLQDLQYIENLSFWYMPFILCSLRFTHYTPSSLSLDSEVQMEHRDTCIYCLSVIWKSPYWQMSNSQWPTVKVLVCKISHHNTSFFCSSMCNRDLAFLNIDQKSSDYKEWEKKGENRVSLVLDT